MYLKSYRQLFFIPGNQQAVEKTSRDFSGRESEQRILALDSRVKEWIPSVLFVNLE